MKSILNLILIPALFVSLSLFSQGGGKYRVVFTDKNDSPYSISSPLAFLSQRALDRRTLHGLP
jgi:hypothetical protein